MTQITLDSLDLTEALEVVWDTATAAVCEVLQSSNMCNCPDGECRASRVEMAQEQHDRFYQMTARPSRQSATAFPR